MRLNKKFYFLFLFIYFFWGVEGEVSDHGESCRCFWRDNDAFHFDAKCENKMLKS
jgi:hypothetical protein